MAHLDDGRTQPFDEIVEERVAANDHTGRMGARIMSDGMEIGTWIDAEWDGDCPMARKILAANDLVRALREFVAECDAVDINYVIEAKEHGGMGWADLGETYRKAIAALKKAGAA